MYTRQEGANNRIYYYLATNIKSQRAQKYMFILIHVQTNCLPAHAHGHPTSASTHIYTCTLSHTISILVVSHSLLQFINTATVYCNQTKTPHGLWSWCRKKRTNRTCVEKSYMSLFVNKPQPLQEMCILRCVVKCSHVHCLSQGLSHRQHSPVINNTSLFNVCESWKIFHKLDIAATWVTLKNSEQNWDWSPGANKLLKRRCKTVHIDVTQKHKIKQLWYA